MALYENPRGKIVASIVITIIVCGFSLLAAGRAGVVRFGPPEQAVVYPDTQKVKTLYGTLNPDVFRAHVIKTNPKAYDRLADEIVEGIYESGKKYRISPILIAAVMHTESEYNPFAVSKTGAVSLMQVQPNIWEKALTEKGIIQGPRDLYDPSKSIEAGCYILRHYTDQTKDFSQALNKYLGDDHQPYRDAIAKYIGEIMVEAITREIDANYSLK